MVTVTSQDDFYVALPSDENASAKWQTIKQTITSKSIILLLITVLFTSTLVYNMTTGNQAVSPKSESSLDENSLDLKESFEHFIQKFQKEYASAEEKAHRFKIFAENLLKINKHNEDPTQSYKQGVNQFADLTLEEFGSTYLGYRPTPSSERNARSRTDRRTLKERRSRYKLMSSSLPDSVDWRNKQCVSEVKNQGQCGSCWAFSASGAVEGAYCVKHGRLPDLSEQQLIDCARGEFTHGCNGGDIDAAYSYMIREKGLCSEQEYPYVGHVEHCRERFCKAQVQVLSFEMIEQEDEDALKAAIAYEGPISVAVESDDWQLYHSGIYDAPCGKKLNHGVLVVGYGSTNGTSYWIIKNSWGATWGDEGYIKLTMKSAKKYGECGILLDPSYPVVA